MGFSEATCSSSQKRLRRWLLLGAFAGFSLLLPKGDPSYKRSLAGRYEMYQHHPLSSPTAATPTFLLSNNQTFPPLSVTTKSGFVAQVAVEPHLHTRINFASNTTRKVAFVHVGKAGGNTVRAAYPRLWCRKRLRITQQRGLSRCFRKYWRNDSPLSQQCDLELHMGGVNPSKEIKHGYTTFLYALRNPITRAISSYLYLHHNNTRSPTAQRQHFLKERFYKQCFPTLQRLLETLQTTAALSKDHRAVVMDLAKDPSFLLDHSPDNQPLYCQAMALVVLQSNNPLVADINVHLRDNYQFYYRKTIQAYPEKEILAVRTEHIWEDLQALDKDTGGSGVFEQAGKVANENVKTKRSGQDPTPEQLVALCCLLWEDVRVYQKILNMAKNLPYHSKLQAMQDVWSTCGIDRVEREQYKLKTRAMVLGEANDGQTIQFSWAKWHQDQCPSFSYAPS